MSGLAAGNSGDRVSFDATGQPQARVPAARDDGARRQLPDLIAALCARLPDDRLLEWEELLAGATGPDDPRVMHYATGQSAAGLAEQLKAITQVWRSESPGLPGAALALAVAAIRASPRPPPPQPVVSGPISAAMPGRLTRGIALEVINSASTSLLIASFAAYGADDVVQAIADAVRRGVQVDLLLEESTHAATAFAALPSDVRIWHRSSSAGVLHAKLLAADRHTALLGSANLTDRGLSDNIEVGVVLRDPAVVEPLVDHFRWLIRPGDGVLRRAR
ncbi:DISARM system phospholipase D-like protein DrmC [Streptomyces griseoflavus]|uniref:DISARM system phospholipase D-like protein DrmC n=1 Tax=Streptomyces griseoflavus TaxID=35619 RepID=UPI0033AD6371